MPTLENQCVLHFEFQCQTFLRLYHNTLISLILLRFTDKHYRVYRGLWFNRTHLPLFQNMSVTIYIIFFLSSAGYDFKINYLIVKMRHGMWVDNLLNNLASSIFKRIHSIYQNAMKKTVKFYLEIFEFEVFVPIIKIIGSILRKICLVWLLCCFSSIAN